MYVWAYLYVLCVCLSHDYNGKDHAFIWRSSGDAPPTMLLYYIDYNDVIDYIILIILNQRSLKNKCNERLSLNSLYLPKNRFSKKEPHCHKFLPWEFHQLGKMDLYHTPYPDRRYNKLLYLPSVLLRAGLSFLKNHWLSPKRPTCPTPFPVLRWHISFQVSVLFGYHFPPCCPPASNIKN